MSADSVDGTVPQTFDAVNSRLEEIASAVRDKDLSLEKSIDLFEEAVRLSNAALDLITVPDPDEEH